MNYNDFPILHNNDYQIINTEYTKQQPTRNELIFEIQKEFHSALFSCFQIENKFNQKIKNSLLELKSSLTKSSDTIKTLLNITETKTINIPNFNIFNFTKRIIKIISLLSKWSQTEEKEYYKKVALKTEHELCEKLINLTNALEQSNICFFKYM